jgi:PadR family transcriptional regulator, regulatory protein PadR
LSGASPTKRPVADALRQELRRGTLVLAVLAVLREEANGTAVRDALARGGVEIDEGALYPMLRRLEEQALLMSEWRTEGSRNKRFYRLSSIGAETYTTLLSEWRQQTIGLEALTGEQSR